MPNVHQQDHPVLGRVVPHLVIVGIVQHDYLVLLVGPERARDADPALWQTRGSLYSVAFHIHDDRQVDAQAEVCRRIVGRDLGTGTEFAKEAKSKGRALEELVVVVLAPESLLQDPRGFGEFRDELSPDVSLGEIGVPVPIALVQLGVLSRIAAAAAAGSSVVLSVLVIGRQRRGHPQVLFADGLGVLLEVFHSPRYGRIVVGNPSPGRCIGIRIRIRIARPKRQGSQTRQQHQGGMRPWRWCP
mmetsp:Transcript_6496/g.18614  ORF Transcript_6496/g.18614 Transcript_6496/m.18614 type:complete len:244 (-) Transcript_6496:91-822(-)